MAKSSVNKLKSDSMDKKSSIYSVFTDSFGNKYEGEMINSQRCGKGKLIYFNPEKYGTNVSHLHHERVSYDGDWKDNQKDGFGIEIISNGSKYEGEWKKNQKCGKGIITGIGEVKYIGAWKDDKRNGKGGVFWPDGSSYEDIYKDGSGIGQKIYKDSNGNHYKQYLDDNQSSKECLLIERRRRPTKYLSVNQIDTILVCFDDYYPHSFTHIEINHEKFDTLNDLLYEVYNNLLSPGGHILLRLRAYDLNKYGDNYFCDDQTIVPEMLREFIRNDCVEFIAQCVTKYRKHQLPFVKSMLIGITSKKEDDLAGKVRFISMPDKLEEFITFWTKDSDHDGFSGVPFSRSECLREKEYIEIPNDEIYSLYPYEYLPPNLSMHTQEGEELGKFVMISPITFPEKVGAKISYSGERKLFDSYTDFIHIEEEKFEDINKQHYHRRIITDDAIIFSISWNSPSVESLMVLKPEQPYFVNYPEENDRERYISIQLKPEWKNVIDIEYLYLETRQPDFLSQFYFYNGQITGTALTSSTILKAKIAKYPPINDQREIVRKEKEKYFSSQKANLASHQALLNFEEEKKSLEQQLGEIDDNLKIVKQDIVNSDQILKRTIDLCDLICESVRDKVREELYYILPIKKCFDQGFSCSTKEVGNKVRKVLEGIILTLKDIQIIPSYYDVGKSVDELCNIIQQEVEMSVEISNFLQEGLPKIKFIGNDGSHLASKQNVQQDEIIQAISVLIALMDWLKELALKNNIIKKYNQRVNETEQLTPEGYRRRPGLIGVITSEYINKAGKKTGASVVLYDGKKTEVSISLQKIRENNLGFGSIVEVNAINKGWGWETEQIKVVTPCPEIYRYAVNEYFRKNDEYRK